MGDLVEDVCAHLFGSAGNQKYMSLVYKPVELEIQLGPVARAPDSKNANALAASRAKEFMMRRVSTICSERIRIEHCC